MHLFSFNLPKNRSMMLCFVYDATSCKSSGVSSEFFNVQSLLNGITVVTP
ncbi:MAG: hypothetical protein AB8B67_00280 [Rickettsiaceae bacterium]